VRALDFALRSAFFAIVPFIATFVSARFPMTPVLVNIALTLLVFAAAESVRERAARSPIVGRLVKRRLLFVEHYRAHPPRPFLFYVFYPLLLPLVLARAETRRELWLYRGLTGAGVAVLLIAATIDYSLNFRPELGLVAFARSFAWLFAIQTLAIFVFLMPASTTIVKLHLDRRFVEIWILIVIGATSVATAATRLAVRKRHVVSWIATQRVAERTAAAPERARAAQIKALRAAWDNLAEVRASTDAEGWVEGNALARVEKHLALFYKSDEAHAFSLHAHPASSPEVLVLQCSLGRDRPPIWRALRRNGKEVERPSDLPKGVLGLERREARTAPLPRGSAPSITR
jgi:hypothetical protein